MDYKFEEQKVDDIELQEFFIEWHNEIFHDTPALSSSSIPQSNANASTSEVGFDTVPLYKPTTADDERTLALPDQSHAVSNQYSGFQSIQALTDAARMLATSQNEGAEDAKLKFKALLDAASAPKARKAFRVETLVQAMSLYDPAFYDDNEFPAFATYFSKKMVSIHRSITAQIIMKEPRLLEYLSSDKVTNADLYDFFLKSLADYHHQNSYIDYYHKILPRLINHIHSSHILIKKALIQHILTHFGKQDSSYARPDNTHAVVFYPIMVAIFNAIDDIALFSDELKSKLKNFNKITSYTKWLSALLIWVIDHKIKKQLLTNMPPKLAQIDVSEENIRSYCAYSRNNELNIDSNYVALSMFNGKYLKRSSQDASNEQGRNVKPRPSNPGSG